MPHIPLYVPDDVRNPDPLYAYINTIEHIDSEVGRLLDRLDDLNLADNTYVLYTTDNGPWLRFKHHGGTAGPLRDGKGTTFEGGQRVPCVLRGPGVPAGSVCHELTGTIDVLPTLAALIGGALPSEHRIDGVDMSALWHGKKEAVSRRRIPLLLVPWSAGRDSARALEVTREIAQTKPEHKNAKGSRGSSF